MPDLLWRAITMEDAGALTRLIVASEAVDATGDHYDEDDVVEELSDPHVDLDRDTIAAWDGDRMVAYAMVRVESTVRDVDRVHIDGTVDPAYRRQGVGRQLLDWSSARAEVAHGERHPESPGEVHVTVLPTNTGHRAMVERAGFDPVRWFHVMRRDMDRPVAPRPVPDGPRLEPFDFRYDEATRHARNAAFADHWGSVERDEAVWRQWFTGQRSFRPQLSTLLIDDTDRDGGSSHPVVGFALSYEYEAESAAEGIRQVWLGQIGVRPEWRGRGAASALMARTLELYRDAGYERARLDVDTGNASGALRLYEGSGWVTDQEWVAYARRLADSEPAVTRP